MNHQLTIRKEEEKDHKEVRSLIQDAFKKGEEGFDNEDLLVQRLRNSKGFIAELSLIAEMNEKVVGFILFSEIMIKGMSEERISLALAPVAVLSAYQKRGLGAKLINAGHAKAKELGYKSVVLLGHAEYYPKFGYQLASKYGVQLPFEAPDENCMLIELEEGSLKGIDGEVVYPKEFYE